ncbi:MAG: CHC2 zinc finger domain-containing protein [Thermomicrobiales bacterium]
MQNTTVAPTLQSRSRLVPSNRTRPHTRFLAWSTAALRDDLEHYLDLRAAVLADGDASPESIAWLDERWRSLYAPILAEIERRDQNADALSGDPLAPAPSHRNNDLMALAADLKAAWPIEQFCADLLAMRLEGRGARLKGRCPLPGHNDDDPSFTVYVSDNRTWCFGCWRGGDVIDLTRHYFGLSTFREAVEKLQDETRTFFGEVRR